MPSNDDFSDLDDLTMDLSDLAEVDVVIKERTTGETLPMDVVYVSPTLLLPNPWNPNAVDPINQQKLENSIKRDGIKRPIVVRELANGEFQIIGGQHRTKAAVELGMTEVPVISRGTISDAEAKKETLLDNYRYGSDNLDRLSELLSDPDIGDAATLLDTMPIDEEELANYFSHLHSMDHDSLDAELEEVLGDPKEIGDDEDDGPVDLSTGKPVRTHQIIRFRVSVEDQAKIAELIKQVKIDEGFVESDDLTNDGDALVQILRDMFQ